MEKTIELLAVADAYFGKPQTDESRKAISTVWQSQTFGRPRMISQNRRFTMSYRTASGRTSCFLTGWRGFRRFRESDS